MTSTRAAVAWKAGEDPAIESVELAEPGLDQVLVRVVATGVCHTDVAWVDGEFVDVFPAIVGHESAGIVEAVGSAVTRVKPGDRVGLALAHHCGHCRYCESGRPMLCAQRVDNPARFSIDGTPIVQGFGTAGFSELTVVREATTIPLPDDVPLEVAAIVGCATSTGLGAVFNIAQVEYGSTVAIFGAGGVGLNVLMGCDIAGAGRIVVVDPNAERRQLALQLGATDAVEPDEEALRAIAPEGFEYVFESVGRPPAMEMAIRVTERGGTVTIIGAARPDDTITINALDFVPSQRRILGCLTGNVRPNVDFPRYFRLFSRGRLPLDKLVTGHVSLDQLGTGFQLNRDAMGIRTLVHLTDE